MVARGALDRERSVRCDEGAVKLKGVNGNGEEMSQGVTLSSAKQNAKKKKKVCLCVVCPWRAVDGPLHNTVN